MQETIKNTALVIAIAVLLLTAACQPDVAKPATENVVSPEEIAPTAEFALEPAASPVFPDLQAELLDDRGKTTVSPMSRFDFNNFTYPLPRGWHNPDGDEITLSDGRLKPKFQDVDEEMSSEGKAARKAERRIGMSFVTTKYIDVTGDEMDEAIVVLKIETGGNAIPQLVYIYEWKDGKAELLWNFRTGDRADGGLKDIRVDNGEMIVELYGQDRFLLGQTETGKITGDEEQLCCPTFFTRSFYKWNGKNFLLQRKRLTFEVENLSAPPLENYGDVVNKRQKNDR